MTVGSEGAKKNCVIFSNIGEVDDTTKIEDEVFVERGCGPCASKQDEGGFDSLEVALETSGQFSSIHAVAGFGVRVGMVQIMVCFVVLRVSGRGGFIFFRDFGPDVR